MAKKVNTAPKINSNIFSKVTNLKKESNAPETKAAPKAEAKVETKIEPKSKNIVAKEVIADKKEETTGLTAVNIFLNKEDKRQLKILLADKDLKQKEYLTDVVRAALRKAGY